MRGKEYNTCMLFVFCCRPDHGIQTGTSHAQDSAIIPGQRLLQSAAVAAHREQRASICAAEGLRHELGVGDSISQGHASSQGAGPGDSHTAAIGNYSTSSRASIAMQARASIVIRGTRSSTAGPVGPAAGLRAVGQLLEETANRVMTYKEAARLSNSHRLNGCHIHAPSAAQQLQQVTAGT